MLWKRIPWIPKKKEFGSRRAVLARLMSLLGAKPAAKTLRRPNPAGAAGQRPLGIPDSSYRTLVERIPAVTYISALDARDTTLYISPQVEQLLGVPQEEYWTDHETWSRHIHPEDRGRVLAELARCHTQDRPFVAEYRMIARDGRTVWIRDEATILYDENGRPHSLQGLMLDITQRKEAEEALRLSEERFAKVFRASPVPMMLTRLADGRLLNANDAFLELTGYRREEALGRTLVELGLITAQERQDRISLLRQDGAFTNVETSFRTKSGETGVGLVSAHVVNLGGEQCVLTTVVDITERKLMEQEMARLDRLHVVGEMAAGIAHEIRNPMAAARGFIQLLGEKEDCSPYRRYFDMIIAELDRANAIISEYLALARNRPVILQVQNLVPMVEALVPLIQADAISRDQTVRTDLRPVPDLSLNHKEIRQLVLNLARNGLEAMGPGGVLTIRTYKQGADVVLEVNDQGGGIAPEALGKLGTPFFTTKEQGVGLGLAVCESIAAKHRATIEVETGMNGTSFRVRFRPPKAV